MLNSICNVKDMVKAEEIISSKWNILILVELLNDIINFLQND